MTESTETDSRLHVARPLPMWAVQLALWEAVLLPMFHVGPVPVKLLYLVVLWFFLGNRPANGLRHFVVWIFGAIAILTVVGWYVRTLQVGSQPLSGTLTFVFGYLVAPAAFCFGWHHRDKVFQRIPMLVLVYFVMSVLATLFWAKLVHSPIGWLYYYREDFLGPGLILLRAGGLHGNPHISALFMTVLFLFLYVGLRYRQVQASQQQVALAIAAAILLSVILASRSEMVTAAVIGVSIFWLLMQRRSRGKWMTRIVGSAALLVGAGLVAHSIFLSEVPLAWLFNRILSFAGEIAADPNNTLTGLGRPFRYWIWGIAPERLATSPVVGTGGEGLGYHNDWLILLVSAGLLGLFLYLTFVAVVARIEPLFLLPFLLAGMTNSFLYAPQHFTLFMILLGATARLRYPTKGAVPALPLPYEPPVRTPGHAVPIPAT